MANSTIAMSNLSRSFTIGGIGHRDLQGRSQTIGSRIDGVLRQMIVAHENDQLSFICSLAEGADRLLLAAARRLELPYDCVLPCSPKCFSEDFSSSESRVEFEQFLADARSVLQPHSPVDKETGYLWASEAVLHHADVVIAVWNGKLGNGPAGTAQTVGRALARGKTVIQVPVSFDQPVRLLESDAEMLR
jgi:hypothetical protein